MKPCTRVGLDAGTPCNMECVHCFYRFEDPKPEPTLGELQAKVDKALNGGLDHAVLVGYGEPCLAKHALPIVDYCHANGMRTSMISNGASGLDRLVPFFERGMDHLHLSLHGLGDTADTIFQPRGQRHGVFHRQCDVIEWLRCNKVPFRTNTTLQQLNYKQVPDIAEFAVSNGVYHVVMLGFLPHYRLAQHTAEIAVHPAKLRPYIEAAADAILYSGTLFTIRYHPLCHLSPRYWPYVTNARYVFMDPWEWNYELQTHDLPALWNASVACGESVAVKGKPCSECLAYRHCGGWNSTMAASFDGAGLQAIREIPEQFASVWDHDGGVFDLNPANHGDGVLRKG